MIERRLALGAPGIYELPPEPIRALTGVRMDVAAFVGVAPRGPAREKVLATPWAERPEREGATSVHTIPVAVESWDEYVRLFGAFEGPGLLPYAVASFFENGGRRAYVARVVPLYVRPDGTEDDAENAKGRAEATLSFTPPAPASPITLATASGKTVVLRARNEGTWGNALSARLSFRRAPLGVSRPAFFASRLTFDPGGVLPAGTLLRLDLGGGSRALRYVASTRVEWDPSTGKRLGVAELDGTTGVPARSAEVVEGELAVDDGAGRTELLTRLGLSPDHPRWLARAVYAESTLLFPGEEASGSWLDADALAVPDALAPFETAPFAGGLDRYADITPEDFFGGYTPGDEAPGRGVEALVHLGDLSVVVAPDLYSPRSLGTRVVPEDPSLGSGEFEACLPPPPPAPIGAAPEELTGLALDPLLDLDRIVELQRRLVDLAEALGSFVVFLDVPPRLHPRQILEWRSRFDSAYAAAYHPWLDVSEVRFARLGDRRTSLRRVNPSAVAAGVLAKTEVLFGVPHGPANELAEGVVGAAVRVPPREHDLLHPNAINVFVPERDGVRLTAARTLSLDPSWRQLSVRRLVTMLKRTLEVEMQEVVFEPNDAALRATVKNRIDAFLGRLFRANAFRGATEREAFFVRCDEALNPPAWVDQGRLLALIGVAPAEPLEFLVLQLMRSGDGTLRVAER